VNSTEGLSLFRLCYDRAVTTGRRTELATSSAERRLFRIRAAFDVFPPRLRALLRDVMRFGAARLGDVVDAAQFLSGRRDPLMPPRRMIFVGSNSIIKSDYHAIGRALVDLAVQFAELGPDSVILEVGSGTGRIAASLTRLLSPRGRFEGFDIVREGVEWCRRHITPRHPQFRFQHANLFNAVYNPDGSEQAATYRFPYDDDTFDLVIATSVLTHMYRTDAAHYLREVARVLKPGGRSFITHFLSTEAARAAAAEGRAVMNFLFPVRDGVTIDEMHPEAAIAIDLPAVRADYEAAGLSLDPIRTGRWAGQTDSPHFQDIVVARKPGRQQRESGEETGQILRG
jgi:ubiquinone/menaquinone biosynthesis C-methylase UbiE